MRNPEIGVGHLEKWAEMLQILKDIAGNRMPSVADLLKQASQGRRGRAERVEQQNGHDGANPRRPRPAPAGEPRRRPTRNRRAFRQIVDQESSQNPRPTRSRLPPPSASKSQSSPAWLPGDDASWERRLRQTQTPRREKMDEAVKKQQDLLAEFEKIADELKRVLAELEGSTLVKRLKAAARLQYTIAGLHRRASGPDASACGPTTWTISAGAALAEVSEQESKGSEKVSLIMDDMEAYFDRHRYVKIKSVLDDMRKQDVIGNLRQLAGDLRKEKGLSIAQCEYWSDTLDRWAEDLVDPACKGSCTSCNKREPAAVDRAGSPANPGR